MHKFFNYVFLAILAVSARSVFAAAIIPVKPLEVGIVPYMSARALITSYEPMRRYLEQTLGRPVKVYTSNGFKQFFLNAQRGDYDLVITASHFARILQKEDGYTPLVRFAAVGHASIVTALDSPIKTTQDLRGHILAVPDKLSLSTIVVLSYLDEQGLRSDTDYQLLEMPSFASAILSVQKGEAMAAVSAPGILAQMPEELSGSVTTIAHTGEFLRNIFLSHPHMERSYADLIKHALLKFGSDSDEGKKFIRGTGSGAIIPVTASDMGSLDRYIAETKRLLAETP